MKPTKDIRVYLDDIRDAILRIGEYTTGGKDEFFADEKTQDAVIRQLSIVGEAASRLPASVRANHLEIPWKKVIGMRNILVHEYSDTSMQRVWDTVQNDLPPLRGTIDAMLTESPS